MSHTDKDTSRPRERVLAAYQEIYGHGEPLLVRSPGRVNLIGGHTDYNDGFVLPLAINRAIWIAFRPREDDKIILDLLDFNKRMQFSLEHFKKSKDGPAEYVKGIAHFLAEAGYTLHGFEGVIAGDVPVGAGLSSSAALELAVARAFQVVGDFEWDPPQMAQIARRAENEWVGVSSGIMDQMICASGKADHALLIDCRSLDTELVPLPQGVSVVVLDTGTRRELAKSAYNERRDQCKAAADHFGVAALRDVDLTAFAQRADELDEVVRKRARHIISENARVLRAKEAANKGDASMLGALLSETHRSLRDDFEVSSKELDAIAAAAQSFAGCYGARMTGGGFAGCAIALVDDVQVGDFVTHVLARYSEDIPDYEAVLYVCMATDGTSVEAL